MSPTSSAPSEPSLPTTAAELLAANWPPLDKYWRNLRRVSAKQAAFLTLDCQEAFYGGAAGGGKSDALLAAALQYVDVPRYSALILRKTYTDLALPGAIMSRAEEWLAGTDAQKGNEGKEWTFPSGAKLTFAYLDNEADRYRYKSAEFQFIAFDELTQFSERVYEYLFTRLRATEDINVPLRMRGASNPGDIGHGWVRKRFIKDREPGVVFVPARLDDHPDETFKAGYRQSLGKLDEVTRRQYEDGDWDVSEGLAFSGFRDETHCVPLVTIPDSWLRFGSFDHGTTNPACLLAWAVDEDGNCLIFDEYYAGKRLPSAHAAAILERHAEWVPDGADFRAYADPEMWAVKGETRYGEPASDITDYRDLGIDWFVRANNRRSAGRTRVAELLKPDEARYFPRWHPLHGETGSPRLFIVAGRCPNLVDQVSAAPLLPIDSGRAGAGEIVDPAWESKHGHAVAALRYGAMSRSSPSEPPPPPLPADRRALELRKMLEADNQEQEDEWQ